MASLSLLYYILLQISKLWSLGVSPTFMLITSYGDCVCPGSTLVYECNITKGATLVFHGSAFDCPSTANEITFVQRQNYNYNQSVIRSCNDGAIVAETFVESTTVSSRLTVTLNNEVTNQSETSIICSADNGTDVMDIGRLFLPPICDNEPPPPPLNINWERIGYDEVSFTWDRVNSSINCSCIHFNIRETDLRVYYNILPSNCGVCPPVTTDVNITCTLSPIAEYAYTVCTIAIQAVACGNISGNWSKALHIQLEPQGGLSQRSAGCVCPGDVLTYQCIARNGTAIEWRGSALNCNIVLHHELFLYGNATGGCQNNTILARGLRHNSTHYVSILNITLTSALNEKTIECVYQDEFREVVIGRERINTAAMLLTGKNPSPTDTHVTDLSPTHITFKWSPVLEDCHMHDNILYHLHSVGCGTCPVATLHPTVTCNNPIIDGSVCNFYSSSLFCGSISAENISNVVNVKLKLPEIQQFSVLPHYIKGRNHTESIIMMKVMFVHDSNYLPLILHNATLYAVSYSGNINTCRDSVTIPSQACVDSICKHDFIIPQSTCLYSEIITVSAVATNALGTGQSLHRLIRGNSNIFVNITYEPTSLSVICHFMNQEVTETMKFCSINYAPSEMCDNLTLTSEANSSSVELKLPLSLQSHSVLKVCYLATASNGTYTVSTQGVIDIACNSTQLGDNTTLSSISCDAPFKSIGINGGIACYIDTSIGSTAVYFCHECGFSTIQGRSTRTCLPSGKWSGERPQCNCDEEQAFLDTVSMHKVTTYTTSSNSRSSTVPVRFNASTSPHMYNIINSTVTSSYTIDLQFAMGTQYSGVEHNHDVNAPLIGVSSLCAVLVCITVMLGISVIVVCVMSKRNLQRQLIEMQESMNPIYEDIEIITPGPNVAYKTVIRRN